MHALVIQVCRTAVVLLLALQVVLVGFAASAASEHVRPEVFLTGQSATALRALDKLDASSSAAPGQRGAKRFPKPLGDRLLWLNPDRTDQALWITDEEGRLTNQISAHVLGAYRTVALSASVLAAALGLLAMVAVGLRQISRIAAAGTIGIAAAHFAGGFSAPFELNTATNLTFAQQLIVIALCIGVFVAISRRYRPALISSGRRASRRAVLAYASQSGSALALARRFQASSNDRCDLVSLAELTQARLATYDTLLVIASTFGDGEPPDRVRSFVSKLEQGWSLDHDLRFSVLALGDQRYANFCAFGFQLHELLKRAGAVPLIPVTTVNRLDPAAIAHWWRQTAERFRWNAEVAQSAYEFASILDNTCLNPAIVSRQVHCISLTPIGTNYQAGDLLEIRPHSEPEAAQRHTQGTSAALEPQAVSDQQARTYSLASAPCEPRLRLLVRRRRREDGTPGLISNQLGSATQGDRFQIAIRSNPSFHLPKPHAPIIMVAAGTGLAPFLGFLAALKAERAAGPHWLFFGEQSETHDSYLKSELEAYQSDGTLHRYSTAWSQGPNPQYIQSVLASHRAELIDWVRNKNAHIYLCGARQGFGEAATRLLTLWFGAEGFQELVDQAVIHSDLY